MAFITTEPQSIVIASALADSMIALGTTADTITTTPVVGQHIEIICTGQQMFVVSKPTVDATTTSARRLALVSQGGSR